MTHFTPENGDSMFLWNAGIYLSLHSTKTQKNIIILTAMKTSNSTSYICSYFSYCERKLIICQMLRYPLYRMLSKHVLYTSYAGEVNEMDSLNV
jgi:hypothetical protein